MAQRPIARRELARDLAFKSILGAIEEGQLIPGELIAENAFLEWLGMSRTPFGDAVDRLEVLGHVARAGYGGIRITTPTARDYREELDAMAALDALVARSTAPIVEPGDLRRIDDAARSLTRASGRADAFAALDRALDVLRHRFGNQALLDHHGRSRSFARRLFADERFAAVSAEGADGRLGELSAALRDGDGAAAEEAVLALYRDLAAQISDDAEREPGDADRNGEH